MPDTITVKNASGSDVVVATNDVLLTALLDLAPASGAIAVTPSDSTVLTGVRSLKIGTGGTLRLRIGVSDFNFTVSDGELLPIKASRVMLTGTTATGIVALT